MSYENNINIGEGILTITGIGEYTGKITKQFNILRKDINFTLIDDIIDQNYTGKEIKPQVTITSDYIKLKENNDYTIEYKNNIEVGTATIKITGINNYTGTMTKTFNIKNKNTNIQKENNADSTLKTDTDVQSIKENKKKSNNLTLPYTGFTYIFGLGILVFCIFMIINYINYKRNNI